MRNSFKVVLAALFSLTIATQAGYAHNVPGSANANTPEMTEIAVGTIVGAVRDLVRPMRSTPNSVSVTKRGGEIANEVNLSFGDRTQLSFHLGYRNLDTARLSGDFWSGAALLGHNIDAERLVFAGLIGERGNVNTRLDNGKISHQGLGFVFGADMRVSESWYLTGLFGLQKFDYRVSRDLGAITGSFSARRQFVDLTADYISASAYGEFLASGGLTYLRQKNDGYVESGGAVVPSATYSSLSAVAHMRHLWGLQGDWRPYADVTGSYRVTYKANTAPVLAGQHSRWFGRLGLGGERQAGAWHMHFGLGANFDRDGFAGPDATLNYGIRF